MITATGKPEWHYAYASHFTDPFGYNNGPRCTPLLTSNFCYTFGAEGKLVCLDLKSGRLVWQRDTLREWNVPEPFFGVGRDRKSTRLNSSHTVISYAVFCLKKKKKKKNNDRIYNNLKP